MRKWRKKGSTKIRLAARIALYIVIGLAILGLAIYYVTISGLQL